MAAIKGIVSGRVQGVGFRYFIKCQANMHYVAGYAKNRADGRVEFLLQGDQADIDAVIAQIRQGPDYSRVDDVTLTPVENLDQTGFQTY